MKPNRSFTKYLVVFTYLALAASGCNLFKGSGSTASATTATGGATSPACTYSVSGVTECILYPTATTAQAAVDAACSSVTGTESTACASANLLGTCANATNANGSVIYYYSSGIITTQSAASSLCSSQNGTFTAG